MSQKKKIKKMNKEEDTEKIISISINTFAKILEVMPKKKPKNADEFGKNIYDILTKDGWVGFL